MLGDFKEEKLVVFRNLDRIFIVILLILLALYLASGLYVIQANEEGLTCRFGAIKKEAVKPGIHYRTPWPIDRVYKVKIKEVKRIEFGFWPESEGEYTEILPYCITGDRNIIHNQFVIQYRVVNPIDYRINTSDPERILKEIANASIIKVVSQKSVDPLLTTGKREMELEVMKQIQQDADLMKLGVSVISIETKLVEPPRTVSEAFKDVINALEEKSTMIHEAENYRNKIIPDAKAEANRLIEEAEAYRYQRVTAANGESERFTSIYEKYLSAPKPMRSRMFLQMVEEIMPRVKIYVLATDEKGRPVKINIIRGAFPTIPQLQSVP